MRILTKTTFIILSILSLNINALMLNLKNTDIKTFINTVAMTSGKNFIVDPRVTGVVNIIGNKEIDDDELYSVFLTVMKVYGFSVIEGESVTRIVPNSSIRSESSFVSREANDAIVTKIIRPENTKAAQIVPIIRPLMSQYGFLNIYDPANSIIAIDTAANINRLENIIRDLDLPTDDDFDFIAIEYSSASSIAAIIRNLMAENTPPISVDIFNNQLIVGGSESKRLKIRLLVSELDQKVSGDSGTTSILYLQNASAVEILPILQNIYQFSNQQATEQSAQTGSNPQASNSQSTFIKSNIQADKTTNSIIVTGDSKTKNAVKEIIEKLDVRRAQVLIEAIIAEVSSSDSEAFGVDWISNENNVVGLSNFTGSIPALITATQSSSPDPSILSGLSQGLTLVGGKYDSSTKKGFGGVITALNGMGTANILSTPSILTLDNEEAEIIIGQEVPFITNSEVSTSGNPFRNFERKDVGLKLIVTPQINDGSAVKLDIFQEISNILPSADTVDVVTSKRTLKTSVIVEDGRVLALGGLIDDTWRNSSSKIPILGDIPGLGKLFSYETKNKEKRNLMIFIRPTILKDQVLAEEISMQKYQTLKAQQLLNNNDFDVKTIIDEK